MVSFAEQDYRSFLRSISSSQKAELRLFLETYVTEAKQTQMHEVLKHRTRYVAVVLENVFQPHNASAAIRSCECFGFQDLHVVEVGYDHTINPNVTMGSTKWVTLHHHRKQAGGIVPVLEQLKTSGYQIAATSLRPGCVPLDQLDLSHPQVLCFGTEERGLSDEAHDLADSFVQIPSYGFTQSFNVSVSVALSLNSIRTRLEHSDISWALPEAEREDLYLTWLMKTANRGLVLAKHFFDRGLSAGRDKG